MLFFVFLMIGGLAFLGILLQMGFNLIKVGGTIFIFYWAISYYIIFAFDFCFVDIIHYYIKYFMNHDKYCIFGLFNGFRAKGCRIKRSNDIGNGD